MQPTDPQTAHVWVRPTGNHGETVPGVIIGWHRALVRGALASPWAALVAVVPFGTALLVQHVGGERILPVADDTPAVSDPTSSDPATANRTDRRNRQPRRHVWVDGPDKTLVPGLVLEWRRGQADWEALTAMTFSEQLLTYWRNADQVRPVHDDSWRTEPD